MAKQTTDPALIAADEAETAEREFFLVPVRNFVDEMSTRYLQAEARWQDAERSSPMRYRSPPPGP